MTTPSIRAIGEPKLELLYEAHIDLDLPQVIGPTPQGLRQIFYVTGGHFEGPRMKGEVLPGGGDWLLVRPDGMFQLDIRATVRTDDGALIYLSYYGLIDAAPDVMARIMQGQDVPVSDYYFYVAPLFQTAAPKYEWLNRKLAVGKGKVVPQGVEYRVFALT